MTIDIEAARQAFRARQEKNFKQPEAAREEALRAVRAVAPVIIAGYPAVKAAYLSGSILRPGAFRSDIGYYLHVLYGLFENIFEEIAETFGNHIADQSQWHSQLLRRMTLEVMPTRPPVISQDTYFGLNELRGFRHLFRNA